MLLARSFIVDTLWQRNQHFLFSSSCSSNPIDSSKCSLRRNLGCLSSTIVDVLFSGSVGLVLSKGKETSENFPDLSQSATLFGGCTHYKEVTNETWYHFSFKIVIILQSALFNFQSMLIVALLVICTCAYIRSHTPSLLDRNKTGYPQEISFI